MNLVRFRYHHKFKGSGHGLLFVSISFQLTNMKVGYLALLASFAFPRLLEAQGHENLHSGTGYKLRTSGIDQSI